MKTKILSNGIRVAVVPLKGLKAVTTEVFVKIGSKYEKVGQHGLSHFLEHMAFKGTPARPLPTSVNQEMDSKGASWNAGTGEEMTSYYVTTVADNMEWSIELLADLLQNPLMDSNEVLKERGVVAEEIKMYRDNPMMGMASDYYKFILGESPIGCWDIAGEVKEILSYNQKDLVDYRRAYFSPERLVIVVAGDIADEEKVFDMISKYWQGMKKVSTDLPKVEVKWTEQSMLTDKRQVEQGHFCLGFEGINRSDPRRAELKLLELVLAGNTSSKLFEAIREERGWAYYVSLISGVFAETGVVGVQSGVKSTELNKAIELTEQIMLQSKDTITNEELVRAKDYIKGKMGLSLDRSDYWTGYVGEKWLLEDKIEIPMEALKRIEKVTLTEVSDLAEEIFRPEKVRKMVISG